MCEHFYIVWNKIDIQAREDKMKAIFHVLVLIFACSVLDLESFKIIYEPVEKQICSEDDCVRATKRIVSF